MSATAYFWQGLSAAKRLTGRFVSSYYGRSVSFFFAVQVVMFVLLVTDNLPAKYTGNYQQLFPASLICSVYLLVGANTIKFIRDLSPVVGPIPDLGELSDEDRVFCGSLYTYFLNGLVVATFLAGGIAFVIALAQLGVINLQVLPWNKILEYNEYASVGVFLLFLASDLIAYGLCKIRLNNPKCQARDDHLKATTCAEEIKLFILAVDMPGVIGILFILTASHLLHPQYIGDEYWQGFTSGAIALHVAFSQVALALVAARDA